MKNYLIFNIVHKKTSSIIIYNIYDVVQNIIIYIYVIIKTKKHIGTNFITKKEQQKIRKQYNSKEAKKLEF